MTAIRHGCPNGDVAYLLVGRSSAQYAIFEPIPARTVLRSEPVDWKRACTMHCGKAEITATRKEKQK